MVGVVFARARYRACKKTGWTLKTAKQESIGMLPPFYQGK